jgi:hypothetical protein
MDDSFYTDILYPFQDEVLRVIDQSETEFYFSGGTAASRGYLRHRFSDGLDLFVNDRPEFSLWAERVIQGLAADGKWSVSVGLKEERFVRLVVDSGDVKLKVEMINDVPAHCGELKRHEVLGLLDSGENILANKVTAVLDREEPKDLADIWGFCIVAGLSLEDAIHNAHSKAAGVFPADLARVLCSVTRADHDLIRWQNDPGFEAFRDGLNGLGKSLLLV